MTVPSTVPVAVTPLRGRLPPLSGTEIITLMYFACQLMERFAHQLVYLTGGARLGRNASPTSPADCHPQTPPSHPHPTHDPNPTRATRGSTASPSVTSAVTPAVTSVTGTSSTNSGYPWLNRLSIFLSLVAILFRAASYRDTGLLNALGDWASGYQAERNMLQVK